MKTSGDRLKLLLQECNLTASDFAAQQQVTPQHVNNWFRRGVPLARLDEIAGLLSVPPRWLRSGEGPKHYPPVRRHAPRTLRLNPETSGPSDLAADYGDMTRLPFCKVRGGHLRTVRDRYLQLPQRALDALGVATNDALCVGMPGFNMAPLLPYGTTLAIDRSMTRVVEGEAYALLHNGALRIHYLSHGAGGTLCLHSHDAQGHPDESYSRAACKAERLHVIGWVFWWSHLRPTRPD
ncbi:helix-turn-helix transcriptional regulator [Pseudomonas capeferrum]|uniref:LexA family transcriptional regulator n=1 Tax=Pseudomonas capeferrum TaxID=1495066 RepID=UPI0015E2C674|nr:XRE family transcriptional regulator [Pseudomonas capeferrum]MBA1203081.1 helix-turn-helix transcriptional regulator [Pseudomonas capeferrum]